jgi:hypothetical protein
MFSLDIGIHWHKNAGNASKLTQGAARHNRKQRATRARVISSTLQSALMPESRIIVDVMRCKFLSA